MTDPLKGMRDGVADLRTARAHVSRAARKLESAGYAGEAESIVAAIDETIAQLQEDAELWQRSRAKGQG